MPSPQESLTPPRLLWPGSKCGHALGRALLQPCSVSKLLWTMARKFELAAQRNRFPGPQRVFFCILFTNRTAASTGATRRYLIIYIGRRSLCGFTHSLCPTLRLMWLTPGSVQQCLVSILLLCGVTAQDRQGGSTLAGAAALSGRSNADNDAVAELIHWIVAAGGEARPLSHPPGWQTQSCSLSHGKPAGTCGYLS